MCQELVNHQMKLNVQLLTIFDFIYHPNQCFFFPNRFCHFPNQKIGILLGQKIFFSVKSSDFANFFGKIWNFFQMTILKEKKPNPQCHYIFHNGFLTFSYCPDMVAKSYHQMK